LKEALITAHCLLQDNSSVKPKSQLHHCTWSSDSLHECHLSCYPNHWSNF